MKIKCNWCILCSQTHTQRQSSLYLLKLKSCSEMLKTLDLDLVSCENTVLHSKTLKHNGLQCVTLMSERQEREKAQLGMVYQYLRNEYWNSYEYSESVCIEKSTFLTTWLTYNLKSLHLPAALNNHGQKPAAGAHKTSNKPQELWNNNYCLQKQLSLWPRWKLHNLSNLCH